MKQDYGINQIASDLATMLIQKGHFDNIKNKNVYATSALIHTEVSEYTQLYKRYGMAEAFKDDRAMEIADMVFRVLNLALMEGIDVAEAVRKKLEFNWSRPYKFGTAEEGGKPDEAKDHI
jgi:NTP pyrophosphatase (non-canonical NTP hydrolase)